jgi:hypothetical protein
LAKRRFDIGKFLEMVIPVIEIYFERAHSKAMAKAADENNDGDVNRTVQLLGCPRSAASLRGDFE